MARSSTSNVCESFLNMFVHIDRAFGTTTIFFNVIRVQIRSQKFSVSCRVCLPHLIQVGFVPFCSHLSSKVEV